MESKLFLGQWEHQVVREKKMCEIRLPAIILCILISSHHVYQYEIADPEISEPDDKYDILIYTQQWPVSVCKWWVNEENGRECRYPNEKNRWAVHGIWPRKYCANYTYCNMTWVFDPEEIKSIKGEVEQAWTSIYKERDPYEFWEHEWLKHGTCATELEPLNSEFKYFNQGIEWNKKYSLADMLGAANLLPSDTKEFTPEEFTDAVKAKTKKKPMIGCYTINGVLYLHELRICFDKQLNLIDCGPPIDKITCFPGKPVFFPATA